MSLRKEVEDLVTAFELGARVASNESEQLIFNHCADELRDVLRMTS